ncbi:histidine phosphatase family protein [Nodosilinea sp. LEGE 07298]|uniref:SixA phosphatase family protein n=1 Tax=Nodosilinea sp. LEGE 07298 TaxID=2777970 RepID=UPI0018830D1F|nr:histidine phosphatase family protein [Nodosilinea sp. LEGE 07298]MBE9112444.1 histidine phosphatase family protein [Nodosilinea sp. LEGE 07298]
MTKHLILFRHGKSDWQAGSGRDRDRPVAERGITAAKTMGKLLAAAGKVPDLAITSSAVRARTTLELAAEAGRWPCPIKVTDDLYEASIKQVLEVVHQVADHHSSVMLVGHQPTWSDAVTYFMGGGAVQMPTAVMACLAFEVTTWAQVEYGRGTLVWLLPPRLFV